MTTRRRGLGKAKADHTELSARANAEVSELLTSAATKLKQGRCHGAHADLMAASVAEGKMRAHSTESGGQMPWFPSGLWSQVEPKFSDVCLRAEKVDVGGWSLGRPRRKPRSRR